jgi:hypothetical protein
MSLLYRQVLSLYDEEEACEALLSKEDVYESTFGHIMEMQV